MKKLSNLKIIQAVVLIISILIGICLLLVPVNANISLIILWILLAVNILFLLLDFGLIRNLDSDYKGLHAAVYSDYISGLPNRLSCDMLIEKYAGEALPNNIGCIMIDLINLPSVNSFHSHAEGNILLREFSNILSSAAHSLGFVGRNGGNKFLVIFEGCSKNKIDHFITRVDQEVQQHNQNLNAIPMEYRAGFALNSDEQLSSITALIALANSRIYQKPDS